MSQNMKGVLLPGVCPALRGKHFWLLKQLEGQTQEPRPKTAWFCLWRH